MKKTIAVDFDGVVHAYSRGWQDGSCYDVPMEGAIEGLKKLMKTYTVFILSTRNPQQIIKWFHQHAPEIPMSFVPDDQHFWNIEGFLGVTNRKLPAQVYIDDRAYLFRSWAEVSVLHDEFQHYPKGV